MAWHQMVLFTQNRIESSQIIQNEMNFYRAPPTEEGKSREKKRGYKQIKLNQFKSNRTFLRQNPFKSSRIFNRTLALLLFPFPLSRRTRRRRCRRRRHFLRVDLFLLGLRRL